MVNLPSDPVPMRTEFRFVLDGIDLDERQKERVTVAVQRAVLDALTTHVQLDAPVVIGHANIRLRPEWYGLWVIDGMRAQELGLKLDEIGFFQP
jgi:hypothetical protein